MPQGLSAQTIQQNIQADMVHVCQLTAGTLPAQATNHLYNITAYLGLS